MMSVFDKGYVPMQEKVEYRQVQQTDSLL